MSTEILSKVIDSIQNTFNGIMTSESITAKVIKATICVIILGVIFSIIETITTKIKDIREATPFIIKGTKSAKTAKIITQDPREPKSITLKRSKNQHSGLEFTYSFWILIDDWTYKYGEWKHVFHKGNQEGYPLRSPGVWLHPKENIMRIYMNTLDNINEYEDIKNIPINKWFCVTIACRQNKMDIYINGTLARGATLSNIPKQNYGNVYVNNFGGFSGYISNLRYYNYYTPYAEIKNFIGKGPSMIPIDYNNSMPPYLDTKWWTRS